MQTDIRELLILRRHNLQAVPAEPAGTALASHKKDASNPGKSELQRPFLRCSSCFDTICKPYTAEPARTALASHKKDASNRKPELQRPFLPQAAKSRGVLVAK